jgi:hypothetical protein
MSPSDVVKGPGELRVLGHELTFDLTQCLPLVIIEHHGPPQDALGGCPQRGGPHLGSPVRQPTRRSLPPGSRPGVKPQSACVRGPAAPLPPANFTPATLLMLGRRTCATSDRVRFSRPHRDGRDLSRTRCHRPRPGGDERRTAQQGRKRRGAQPAGLDAPPLNGDCRRPRHGAGAHRCGLVLAAVGAGDQQSATDQQSMRRPGGAGAAHDGEALLARLSALYRDELHRMELALRLPIWHDGRDQPPVLHETIAGSPPGVPSVVTPTVPPDQQSMSRTVGSFDLHLGPGAGSALTSCCWISVGLLAHEGNVRTASIGVPRMAASIVRSAVHRP